MARIFINYRRSLSYHAAARLRDMLAAHFGPLSIFLDDHAFEKGVLFPERIRQGLSQCEVFLPLIDVGWAGISEDGTPRLHNPLDWVRIEIETVLARNQSRAPGSDEPVLIIPILLNGIGMPKAEILPPELAEITSRFGISFTTERDVQSLIPIIESFLGDPLVGNLGIRLMASSADMSKSKQFRFRMPTSRDQLAPFVNISDDEPDISLANPNLRKFDRFTLYDNWCQWTAREEALPWFDPENETRSFLLLDRRQEDGRWQSIAISIVLPLAREGGTLLAGTSVEAARDPTRKRTAVTFDSDELERRDSRCLLIDTWAVACVSDPASGKRRRINHYNWGIALLLRHLAEFWSPNELEPITIMAEPNERLGRMLSNLGFERRQRNAASGDLYFLDFPLNSYRYGPEINVSVEKIARHVRSLRAIPIVRER